MLLDIFMTESYLCDCSLEFFFFPSFYKATQLQELKQIPSCLEVFFVFIHNCLEIYIFVFSKAKPFILLVKCEQPCGLF